MTNCIFYSLFFALFLNISVGSLKYSQVHRTFMSLYRGMFEACAVTVRTNGDPAFPYYDAIDLRTYLSNYFNENIKRFVKDYTYTFVLLNSSNNYCTAECRRVQIRLRANINYLYKYDRTVTYSIVDGDSL